MKTKSILNSCFLSIDKPEFLVNSLEKFDVIEGETLVANLTAKANPPVISYSWNKVTMGPIPSKSEASSNSISHRVTSRGPLLEIRDSRREDAGQYECEATNAEGTGHIIIVINVLCTYSHNFQRFMF